MMRNWEKRWKQLEEIARNKAIEDEKLDSIERIESAQRRRHRHRSPDDIRSRWAQRQAKQIEAAIVPRNPRRADIPKRSPNRL